MPHPSTIYEYYINRDERGEFDADVRNTNGKTVYYVDECTIEDGFMSHKKDLDGLKAHLVALGLMRAHWALVEGN